MLFVVIAYVALMRPGEVCKLTIGDTLYGDSLCPVAGTVCLIIKEPKTKHSYGRRQNVTVTEPLLLSLLVRRIDSLRARLPRSYPCQSLPLFSKSISYFERGFKMIVAHLGVSAPLTLGSLRAGGATTLSLPPCSGVVSLDELRRRGRWMCVRTMEIYLQELASTHILASLHDSVLGRLRAFSDVFEAAIIYFLSSS